MRKVVQGGLVLALATCLGAFAADATFTTKSLTPETALKAAKVPYTMYKYPGTQHGFNNDTTPRYDEAAAKLAWQRTVDFFNKNLRG